ncbi:hypothetical protein V502_07784 [Pseudogymnoascus sp. VKM F-4520 (FW-2644)]|nr:hypothetical protein V502_07784 [Pseudogymnoascus sp. VKM F-4520 (FW-2644)]
MTFQPPSWVPKLSVEIPDTLSIGDFMLNEQHGRYPLTKSKPPFVCGLSGKAPSATDVKEQVDLLARGLSKELGWQPNEGNEWDKVAAVYSLNTIDYLPLAWAIHRLGGIESPANAQYSAADLEYQLKNSGAKCLFTCMPVLDKALEAADKVGIPRSRVYLMELPEAVTESARGPGLKTVAQLVKQGKTQAALEPLRWSKGEGKRRTAFLCYSSGTSGLPKGVMISHYNVIANTLQIKTFDEVSRNQLKRPDQDVYVENVLGLLPFSHIYGLVVIAHASFHRGDSVVVLPRFEFRSFMRAAELYQINTLYLVPPIVIMMINNKKILDQFDLSHVRAIFTGAAPLRQETSDALHEIFPHWVIRQGYGLTETSTVVSSTANFDTCPGSAGSLVPGVEARVLSVDGKGLTGHDQPGELLVKSPAVVLGYLNNPKANEEAFITDSNGDRWLRTGDEVVFRKSANGHEHLFIVDRIKELIKVEGLQVAPAELEAHILTHPDVTDCAVIPVPDDAAGEVPKAYVVKSPHADSSMPQAVLARDIAKYVAKSKSKHKWLMGGVEFVQVIPKNPSGKILRRELREKDKKDRREKGTKL